MKTIISVFAILLAGCATDPVTVKAIADANERAASVPTLVINCKEGCSATYTDPHARPQMRMPTNGWDAAMAISQGVTSAVSGALPYAAIGAVAVHGLRNAGKDTTTTTTNTASGDGAATGGAANYRTEQIADSQNTTTATATDNSNQGNATAAPMVVAQPAPVIVQQPSPTIVYQPDPIIVSAP